MSLDRETREALLAQLVDLPAWKAVLDVLQPALMHQRINFDDPQWAAKQAYQNGRCDQALDLIKAVDRAAETIKKKRQAQADA